MSQANDPTAGMPTDLMEEMEQERLRKQMALALLKKLQDQNPTQGWERMAIMPKLSKVGALAGAVSQNLAAGDAAAADQRMAGIRQQADQAYQQGVSGFAGAGDKNAEIAKLMSSNHPALRAFAAEQAKIQRELAEKEAERKRHLAQAFMPIAAEAGRPEVAASVGQTGVIPDNFSAKAPPPVTTRQFPNPADPTKPLVALVRTDQKGQEFPTPFPGSTNVSMTTRLAGEEGKLNLEREQADLTARQTAAKTGMQNLQLAQRVKNLIRDGAQAGGFQSALQMARKFASTFGVVVPETGFTDELRSALGERILKDAKALGPNPSNRDAEIIAQIVGSIDTDPMAIMNLTAVMEARALKDLGDFKEFLNIKRTDTTNPGLYNTADVGIQGPNQIAGTLPYKIKVAQMLAQQGIPPAQITSLVGLKEEDLPPVDADMGFNLQSYVGPGRGPLAAKPRQESPAALKDDTPLTPEEMKRLEELRRKHGR